VFNGSDDGDSAKDTATCATTGERGMMVATGNGLCVCFGVCVCVCVCDLALR
jgi:hypothetical protein